MATTTTPKIETFIGRRVRRQEDPRLITGTATYVDDVKMPGMLYAAILRSPHGAARIRSLRTEAARKAPGVYALFTGADVEGVGPVPCAASLPGLRVPKHTILATNRVYYVGHAVAVVVATDRYLAADALDQIEVDYDPLPAVSDPEKALAAGAPAVHPEWPDNIAFTQKTEGGDTNKAFAEAQVVVKERIVSQRLVPMAMEPRGVVAEWRAGEKHLTIYSSTQIPHLLRTQLALMLGIAENHLRVITPEVGGGFGSKLNVYAEEALMGFIAMRINRPVKWIESRRENFQTTIHGRGHVDYLELAAKKDGTILGLKLKLIQDLGAYHQLLGPLIPTLSVLMMPGIYNFQNVSAEVIGVFTNAVPTDAYRGAGRPEATHCIERMVDILAAEIKMDPAEIRFKNFPAKDAFPFATATGLSYDSGDYAAPLHKAMDLLDYKKARKEQTAARKQGRYVGIGISTYGEICAFGPSPATPAGGWESATVKIEPTAKVTIMTGASPHGQGQETTFAQIAADALGVAMDDIVVIHGDTAVVQYGIGTFGSRGTAVGGTAVHLALQDLRAKCSRFAAHMLGVAVEEVRFEGGVFSSSSSSKTVSIGDVALEAHVCRNLPPGMEPGLVATRFFEPSNFAFPFGAHIAHVEVDKETGETQILRYIAVDDCGKIINPLLVDGQVHGGVAQGLGQALLEEAVYDDNGQFVTGELMSYAVPKAHHVPEIESHHTETPSPVNPLGVKGVGEAGTIGCSPSLVNAVVDALAPLGVRHIDMPMTPQKVWRIISERQLRMITQPFEYHAPESVSEALKLLGSLENSRVLAGGQSLIPMMKLRLSGPDHLIDLGRIAELHYIAQTNGTIRIGAMSTHHQVATSETLRKNCPLLAEAAGRIGDVQVRNMGTIGGSVAHADPAADYPAALQALRAQVRLVGRKGERTVPIDDFLVDAFTTALAEGEILTEVIVPADPAGAGSAYRKLQQPASGFSVCGVAAQLGVAGGKITHARVGVTGVASRAYVAKGVEEALAARPATAATLAEASRRAAEGVEALSDLFAAPDYRAHLARVEARRALEAALAIAK